jgi:plastocyanin
MTRQPDTRRCHWHAGLKTSIGTPASVLLLLALAASLSAPSLRGQAVIEGMVKVPSPPSAAVMNERYQAVGGAKVADPEPPAAIVYLDGKFEGTPATNAARIQVIQKNLRFQPGLLAVQKGATVEFPNQDDLYHNVFSYSKTKRFDLGRYLKDEKPASVTFDQAGVVKLYCEIHEHMRGTILVLDTPYFQKTGANGAFRLENLPAGAFTLKAWVNEKTTWEKPVELKAGESLKVEFPVK